MQNEKILNANLNTKSEMRIAKLNVVKKFVVEKCFDTFYLTC